MLVVVMHNNKEFLNGLIGLAKKENINEAKLVNSHSLGTNLVGGESSFIFSHGKMLNAYDKAFVAVVDGDRKAASFMDAIKQDKYLDMLNMKDNGFICTLPFNYIEDLKPKLEPEKEGLGMKIGDYLKEERILLNLKTTNKNEVIREIAESLKNVKEVNDFDLFLADVFERESLNSTGIGKHIAIPHARTDGVDDFVIAFGRSSTGIDFDSLDAEPAKFIFLMGTPKNKGLTSYLKTLARLTRLINRKDFQEALLNASTAKEIIAEFQKAED